MIDKIWSGKSWLYVLLLPFSWLYGLVSMLIRYSYRLGLRQSWKAPIPVVVVGNLTAGGNGKTPVVIWLVEQLQQQGINVGVVSRGYGGKAESYPLILNQHTTTDEAGDEPVLIYQRTGVAVAVAPKRRDAVQALIAHAAPIQIIITDDGLQHYALSRDKEIVVIDGVRRFGNGWWLPAGPMRERAGRLASVDAVIVNGGEPKKGEIAMTLKPSDAIHLYTKQRRPLTEFSHVVAMAGIGHPPRFFTMLKQYGLNVLKTVALTDHQTLSLSELTNIVPSGQTLLMTEKDAVKYRAYASENTDWWYIPVDAEIAPQDSTKLVNMLQTLVEPNR